MRGLAALGGLFSSLIQKGGRLLGIGAGVGTVALAESAINGSDSLIGRGIENVQSTLNSASSESWWSGLSGWLAGFVSFMRQFFPESEMLANWEATLKREPDSPSATTVGGTLENVIPNALDQGNPEIAENQALAVAAGAGAGYAGWRLLGGRAAAAATGAGVTAGAAAGAPRGRAGLIIRGLAAIGIGVGTAALIGGGEAEAAELPEGVEVVTIAPTELGAGVPQELLSPTNQYIVMEVDGERTITSVEGYMEATLGEQYTVSDVAVDFVPFARTISDTIDGNLQGQEVACAVVVEGAGLGTAWAGAAGGAAIGTAIFPGVGTAIGGIIGGLGGYLAGSSVAGNALSGCFNDEAAGLRPDEVHVVMGPTNLPRPDLAL